MNTESTTSPTAADRLRILPNYRTVLLPLDGSPAAERALEPARWLAANFGAELHVVTAGVTPGDRWYRDYIGRFCGRVPGVVTHTAETGAVPAVVSALTRELSPCLVCVGTHGRSRSAAVLGSTFVDVARTLGKPLVAVGPRACLSVTEHDGRIVVCVDGSPDSELVLPLAVAWTQRLGLRLSIVVVAEPAPAPVVPEEHHHQRLADPDAYLGGLVAAHTDLDGTDGDTLVVWDPLGPHHGLAGLLEVESATLVAVASRVRSGGGRVLHGSEAARIIHTSPAPVLVRPVPGTT